MLSPEQQLWLSDGADRGTRYQRGETCSVTPPPHYSNRQGCEVCQIGVAHSGAVKTPWLLWWWQPLTSVMVYAKWPICHERPVWESDFSDFYSFAAVLLQVTLVAAEVEMTTIWQHVEKNNFSSVSSVQRTQNALFPAQLNTTHLGAAQYNTGFYSEPLSSSTGASPLTNMLSRACADMHVLFLSASFSLPQHFFSMSALSIFDPSTLIFQTINPLRNHPHTCILAAVATLPLHPHPKACGGWGSPLLAWVGITPLEFSSLHTSC